MTRRKRRPLSPSERERLKPFEPSLEPRVADCDIELIPGKGSKGSGGDLGGAYWHIYYSGERAGRVYINLEGDSDSALPYITVEINADKRGIGIGTIAFRRACQLSPYDEVYATIRKSNKASLIATERAGFITIDSDSGGTGAVSVWRRSK